MLLLLFFPFPLHIEVFGVSINVLQFNQRLKLKHRWTGFLPLWWRWCRLSHGTFYSPRRDISSSPGAVLSVGWMELHRAAVGEVHVCRLRYRVKFEKVSQGQERWPPPWGGKTRDLTIPWRLALSKEAHYEVSCRRPVTGLDLPAGVDQEPDRVWSHLFPSLLLLFLSSQSFGVKSEATSSVKYISRSTLFLWYLFSRFY